MELLKVIDSKSSPTLYYWNIENLNFSTGVCNKRFHRTYSFTRGRKLYSCIFNVFVTKDFWVWRRRNDCTIIDFIANTSFSQLSMQLGACHIGREIDKSCEFLQYLSVCNHFSLLLAKKAGNENQCDEIFIHFVTEVKEGAQDYFHFEFGVMKTEYEWGKHRKYSSNSFGPLSTSKQIAMEKTWISFEIHPQ